MNVQLHPGSKIHVLLVDDDENIRESLQHILLDLEIFASVVTAKDGNEALNRASNQHFDLVITDLMMPKMCGITLINNLRKSSRKTPAIAILSGNITGPEIQKAIKLGIKCILVKPFTEEQFVEKVTKLLCKEVSHKLKSFSTL